MLHSFFFDTAASQPHSPALWVDERLYDYGELEAQARRVSAGLGAVMPANGVRRCLLFAHRSIMAYAGLLGILDAGMAYVPLSPKVPARDCGNHSLRRGKFPHVFLPKRW